MRSPNSFDPGVRLTDSGRYLDCARIGSVSSVFFHYAPGVELELTLRLNAFAFVGVMWPCGQACGWG